MESLDVRVLRQLQEWRAQGRDAILVTVVQTWGSSPRPEGSIMALEKDGAVVGSVSGGCIEDDLIRAVTTLLDDAPVLQAAITLRNPYVDPLSLLQVALLRR